MADKATKTVITPVGFLSFPHLDQPQQPPRNKDGTPAGKAKYSLAIVWPEGTDLSKVETAVIAAATERWGEGAAAKLRSGSLRNPLRSNPDDVKEKKYPTGSTFTNARSEQKPGLVFLYGDPETGKPMIVPDDKVKDLFYPGAKVRADLTFFAYEQSGNKGVGVGLNNVQLVDSTTPRMDGRAQAADAFEAEGTLEPADLSDLEGR